MTLLPYVDAFSCAFVHIEKHDETTEAPEGAPGTAQHLVPVRAGHTRKTAAEQGRAGDVRSGHQAAPQGPLGTHR